MNTDQAALAALRQYWGYETFRPLQQEAVACVAAHQDSVVVLPTGGGKSLCFQLPALLMEGMAVVVSPLIALMKDQVDTLRNMGIAAAAINSTITEAERQSIASDIRARRLKLVYVTPERLVQERFITYLRNNHLSFIAVDEAHCISQWGHDFRPEYRGLGLLRDAFPEAGIHAYTATATPQVRQDIAVQLQLRSPKFFTGAFDRPNLVYRVQPRQDLMAQVREVLQRNEGSSGVIYCLRRKDVDDMCAALCASGHKALPYHAGMDNNSRRQNQEAFIRDEADIIVATVAFGMGIDKPDVRFVIHAGMPKSVEHYQQESGRAGRDGLLSECVLLYSRADYQLWRSFAEKEGGEGTAEAIAKIGQMLDYCTLPACRHAALTSYFGERMRVEKCVSCDVCLGEVGVMEQSEDISRGILQAVLATGERYGGGYIAALLTGARDERMQAQRHTGLAEFGLLKAQSASGIRQWIDQLVAQDYLEIHGEYRSLRVAGSGHAFLQGEYGAPVLTPDEAAGRPSRKVRGGDGGALLISAEDKALFQALRELRLGLAKEEGVPPYMVFGDRTLVGLALGRPLTLESFAKVDGVGSIKLEKYGERFLAVVREFCAARGLAESGVRRGIPEPKPGATKRSVARTAAVERAVELFRTGMSVAEVAEEIGRAESTVTTYLCEAIESGGIEDVSPWVSGEEIREVTRLAAVHGNVASGPIYAALGGALPHAKIQIVLAALRAP